MDIRNLSIKNLIVAGLTLFGAWKTASITTTHAPLGTFQDYHPLPVVDLVSTTSHGSSYPQDITDNATQVFVPLADVQTLLSSPTAIWTEDVLMVPTINATYRLSDLVYKDILLDKVPMSPVPEVKKSTPDTWMPELSEILTCLYTIGFLGCLRNFFRSVSASLVDMYHLKLDGNFYSVTLPAIFLAMLSMSALFCSRLYGASKLAELHAIIEENRKKCVFLEDNIRDSRRQNDDLTNGMNDAVQARDVSRKEQGEINHHAAALENEVQRQNKAIKDQADIIANLKQHTDTLEGDMKAKDKKCEDQIELVNDLQGRIKILEDEGKAKDEGLKEDRAGIKDLEETIEGLREEAKDRATQHGAELARRAHAEDERQQNEAASRNQSREEIKGLQDTRATTDAKVAEQEELIKNLKSHIDEFEQDAEEARKQSDSEFAEAIKEIEDRYRRHLEMVKETHEEELEACKREQHGKQTDQNGEPANQNSPSDPAEAGRISPNQRSQSAPPTDNLPPVGTTNAEASSPPSQTSDKPSPSSSSSSPPKSPKVNLPTAGSSKKPVPTESSDTREPPKGPKRWVEAQRNPEYRGASGSSRGQYGPGANGGRGGRQRGGQNRGGQQRGGRGGRGGQRATAEEYWKRFQERMAADKQKEQQQGQQ